MKRKWNTVESNKNRLGTRKLSPYLSWAVLSPGAHRVEFVMSEKWRKYYTNIIYVRENCLFFLFFCFVRTEGEDFLHAAYAVEAKTGADVCNGPFNEHRDRLSARHQMSEFLFYRSHSEYAPLIRPLSRSFDSLGSQWWSTSTSEPEPKLKRFVCILRIGIRMNENDKCDAPTKWANYKV